MLQANFNDALIANSFVTTAMVIIVKLLFYFSYYVDAYYISFFTNHVNSFLAQPYIFSNILLPIQSIFVYIA